VAFTLIDVENTNHIKEQWSVALYEVPPQPQENVNVVQHSDITMNVDDDIFTIFEKIQQNKDLTNLLAPLLNSTDWPKKNYKDV